MTTSESTRPGSFPASGTDAPATERYRGPRPCRSGKRREISAKRFAPRRKAPFRRASVCHLDAGRKRDVNMSAAKLRLLTIKA